MCEADALGFACIHFDLFEKLDDSIRFSDINDRDIGNNSCNEQQAADDVLHQSLLGLSEQLAVIIHNASKNAIQELLREGRAPPWATAPAAARATASQ